MTLHPARLVWHTVSPPFWRVCATAPAAFLHNRPSLYCRKEASQLLPFLLSCSWNNSLAIDDLDAQRSELQQLRNRGKVYNLAMIDAMDANEGQCENMLPRTELFGVHYPNLLIPVERADEWQASGEHVDGACFQVALAPCRLPEIVRLRIKTIICKRIAQRRLIAT
jgi:hypothetical protein